MKVRVASEIPSGEWVVVRLIPKDQRSKLSPPPTDAEFSGATGSLLNERSERTLYVGLGDRSRLDATAVRSAVSSAALTLRKRSVSKVLLDLELWTEFAGAAVEGLIIGGYRYEEFLPHKTKGADEVVLLVRQEDVASVRKTANKAGIVGESVNYARGLANSPGNVLYPEALAKAAQTAAKKVGLNCRVLDESALRAGKFGGLLAVGGGSVRGPRLIALEHRGGKKGEAPLVLVGKAITFDSGGISIKPGAGMEEMIFDKCGGMAVLGAMVALARLKVPRNVVGVLAAAENMPSGSAYRPGDIVTMFDGTTVEIVNTDAEGRMVLGDALAWAKQVFKPASVVDLATLTGACGVALGEYAAGMWSNHDCFQFEVQSAARDAGERVWPMPLFDEYSNQIKSTVAQIKNSGGRLGGANTAAAFLKTFVGETPWVHLDIAYTSHRTKDQDGLACGATGFGVRTLVKLAERL
ncbi:MAG: leucyl aminopeptidase [Verrucomicrobiota bacterium]